MTRLNSMGVLQLVIVFVLMAYTQAQYATVFAILGKDDTGLKRNDYLQIADAETPLSMLLIGQDFTPLTSVRFTSEFGTIFQDCDGRESTRSFDIDPNSVTLTTAKVNITFNKEWTNKKLQMCTKRRVNESDASGTGWIYQSNEPWVMVFVQELPVRTYLLPLPAQIILIIILLLFSGLFSGLNLGLMSLDMTELQVVAKCGTKREKMYASTIKPVRKHGNYLLCTILLGNVLVNTTLTVLVDDLTGSGVFAVIVSTLCIVIFGEITPQAVCSRYGLAVGHYTIWFTRLFMILTFPLSFPISTILNLILGKEVGATYNRDRLRELLLVTQDKSDLLKNELNIITGALELYKKTVKDVMTPIEDVYMVDYNATLDFDTMTDIIQTGYTRVPVYEKDRKNIVAMLNIKDLGLVDPGDHIPLKTVCHFYNRPVNFVFSDTRLDVMLEEFKKGDTHMSIVQQIITKEGTDPVYETIGVLTLEDVIEEIIQSEIVDETDIISDNRQKNPRVESRRDFSFFQQTSSMLESEKSSSALSPQMSLATYQFLSITVPAFHQEHISESVLQRLLKRPEVVSVRAKEPGNPSNFIYRCNKPADFFTLILTGEVKVEVGQERISFTGGPFTYFGINAFAGVTLKCEADEYLRHLEKAAVTSMFKPDFNVEVTEDTTYLKISRQKYISAIRATLMERHNKSTPLDDNVSSDDTHNIAEEDDDAYYVSFKINDSSKQNGFLPTQQTVRDEVQSNVIVSNTEDIPGDLQIGSKAEPPVKRTDKEHLIKDTKVKESNFHDNDATQF